MGCWQVPSAMIFEPRVMSKAPKGTLEEPFMVVPASMVSVALFFTIMIPFSRYILSRTQSVFDVMLNKAYGNCSALIAF